MFWVYYRKFKAMHIFETTGAAYGSLQTFVGRIIIGGRDSLGLTHTNEEIPYTQINPNTYNDPHEVGKVPTMLALGAAAIAVSFGAIKYQVMV